MKAEQKKIKVWKKKFTFQHQIWNQWFRCIIFERLRIFIFKKKNKLKNFLMFFLVNCIHRWSWRIFKAFSCSLISPYLLTFDYKSVALICQFYTILKLHVYQDMDNRNFFSWIFGISFLAFSIFSFSYFSGLWNLSFFFG